MIQEVLDLIQTYDPNYSRKIQGASSEEIARLQELVGYELPPPYQEFLRIMGKSMGDFHLANADFSIDTVTAIYDESNDWRPPDRYLFIAQNDEDPYLDFYLDLEEMVDGDYKVLWFSNDGAFTEDIWSLVDLFKGFLLASAFRIKRMESLGRDTLLVPSQAKLSVRAATPAQTMATVDEIAIKQGFKKLPFSVPLHPMYDRKDAAIMGTQAPFYGGISFEVAAESDRELKRLINIFDSNTSLVEG